MSLITDAILQANELKRLAVEQVRENLHESITPKISSMLSNRLTEEADDELEEAITEGEQEELEEDFDLSGFVSESEEAPEEEEVEPSFGDESGEASSAAADLSAEPGLEAGAEAGIEGGAEISDETAISDLTVGELKGLLQDIIAGGSDEMDIASFDDEVADAELDGVDSAETSEDPAAVGTGAEDEDDEDLNLESIVNEEDITVESILAEVEKRLNPKPKATLAESLNKEIAKLKKQLKESQDAMKVVTNKLVEVNVLNSKYLYMNKIFKGFNLNESQKALVISNIDKAATVKEAKSIFEALELTLKGKVVKKSNIQESLGLASKAAGVAPASKTGAGSGVLPDEARQRIRTLAGIGL